jgi:hypothetical protein
MESFPRFCCLYSYCHTEFFRSSCICIATAHFSQIPMFVLPHSIFPSSGVRIVLQNFFQLRCLNFHISLFPNSYVYITTQHFSTVQKFVLPHITFPDIQMFLLQYSSFPNSDVCIATQYVFFTQPLLWKGGNPQNINCTVEAKSCSVLTKTNALRVKIFHT